MNRLQRNWPTIATSAFVVLGTLALAIGGKALHDVRHQQSVNERQGAAIEVTSLENRQLNCAITRAITANPIVRYPQFETEGAFRRRVASYQTILRVSRGLDCKAVLAPITVGLVRPRPFPLPTSPSPSTSPVGGGGRQSPNHQGGHLPGGRSSPPPTPTSPTEPPPSDSQLCLDNPVQQVCLP